MLGLGNSRVLFAAYIDFWGMMLFLVVILWILSILGMVFLIQRGRRKGPRVKLPKNWLTRKGLKRSRG